MAETLNPAQFKGIKTGASTHAESATRHDAILLFETAKKRLLDVNNWNVLSADAAATFQLTDPAGKEINRLPQTGDLIRIKSPSSPQQSSEGSHWFRIEEFENTKDLLKDQDTFGFRVKAIPGPGQSDDPAHVHKSASTSTFLIVRTSSIVTALEKVRSENSDSGSIVILHKLKDFVSSVAMKLGLSHSQWSRLVKGIIKGPPQD